MRFTIKTRIGLWKARSWRRRHRTPLSVVLHDLLVLQGTTKSTRKKSQGLWKAFFCARPQYKFNWIKILQKIVITLTPTFDLVTWSAPKLCSFHYNLRRIEVCRVDTIIFSVMTCSMEKPIAEIVMFPNRPESENIWYPKMAARFRNKP